MKRLLSARDFNTLEIAMSSIMANKMRSTLTALGIIFGVAAIITMLAIGKGAEAEILEQLKATGVNNIIINAREPGEQSGNQDQQQQQQQQGSTQTSSQTPGKQEPKGKNYSKGLSLSDAESIKKLVNSIEAISTEGQYNTRIISAGQNLDVKIIGITPDFAEINNITLDKGTWFNRQQAAAGLGVCIIGSDIKKRFFTTSDAIGNYIKCGKQWLKVVGVTAEKATNKSAEEAFKIRNVNLDIYVPIQTLLTRFQDATRIRPVKNGEGPGAQQSNTIHQVKRITVKVKSSGDLAETGNVIKKILDRRHSKVEDFEVVVPELLLKQQQKTKEMFSLVLSIIAGISLLVGGIGIMNIMLASVLERTKEIGTRLAIGAQKKDIVKQFLFEAVLISLSGGFIGVFLGVAGALIADKVADINTIISNTSILISFIVSTGVGIIFGYSPAQKAARQNPIDSLRYE
jgi:putative ABC transport system permease protein